MHGRKSGRKIGGTVQTATMVERQGQRGKMLLEMEKYDIQAHELDEGAATFVVDLADSFR